MICSAVLLCLIILSAYVFGLTKGHWVPTTLYSVAFLGVGMTIYRGTSPPEEILYWIDQHLEQGGFMMSLKPSESLSDENRCTGYMLVPGNVRARKVRSLGVQVVLPKGEGVDGSIFDSIVYVVGDLRRIENFKSAADFDYAQFMADQSIYYLLRARQLKSIGILNVSACSWCGFIRSIRIRYYNRIKDRFDGISLGVLSAVLLGHKDNLDDKIKTVFADTGAMHVLAVSGLHVGIVVFLVFKIMSISSSFKGFHFFIKWGLLMSVILMYVGITGGAPPVQRAGLTVGAMMLGEFRPGAKSRMNVLALVAMMLLLINPRSLFSVSFQMSFLAVIGILSFYRPIYSLFEIKNSIINSIWQLTVVGMAANLALFPLIMFYFDQFTFGFILSGVIAIVGIYFVLIGGVIWLLLGPVHTCIDYYLGVLIELIIHMKMILLEYLSRWRFMIISDISINEIEMLFLYVPVILLGIALNYGRPNLAMVSIILFAAFAAYKATTAARLAHHIMNYVI